MNENIEAIKKIKVYESYRELIDEKVLFLQQKLQDVIESTLNETKSSAGDKHETGRAMLQIEQDNIRKQLKEALEQKATFEKIDKNIQSQKVVIGSLVKTNKGYLFVSVGLGKLIVDGIQMNAISPQSH